MMNMKKIAVFIFVSVFLCMGSGCTEDSFLKNKQNATEIDLVVYSADAPDVISAHKLSVNIPDLSVELSQEILFKAIGGPGWQIRVCPLNLSGKSLVLPYEPLEEPAMEYTLTTEGQLYNEDYILIYDSNQSTATISKKGDKDVGSVELTLDNVQLIPQAFFVDNEGAIAILCNTQAETFDRVNPVSLLYTEEKGTFQLEKISDYSPIFDDFKFSKIDMPNYTNINTNIYGNSESKTFLWNEGANIVELNPYNGTTRVVLTVNNIKTDMPHLDTHRESYGFFTGLGYQNGIYIASFPNYNNLSSTISVFYNRAGKFLGSILCTENYISTLNNENIEKNRIDDITLNTGIFIPQGTLH